MDCVQYYIRAKRKELEAANAEIVQIAEAIAVRAKEFAENPDNDSEINYIVAMTAKLSTLQGKRETLLHTTRMLDEIASQAEIER